MMKIYMIIILREREREKERERERERERFIASVTGGGPGHSSI